MTATATTAACAAPGPDDDPGGREAAQALRGATSRDSVAPPAPTAEVVAAARPATTALVAGANQDGFYDMSVGGGLAYLVPPITAAGGTPIAIADPTAAALAGLNVLWVTNPDNFGFGGEYLARLPEITAAVQAGMVLVIHDRRVGGAQAILPGGAALGAFSDFSEATDINIGDASTVVTAGLDNTSLDGGNFSNHGFISAGSLPTRAKVLLTSTSSDRAVTVCYPVGRGAVIYSTIPLDFYLQGLSGTPPQANLATVYAPNVVKYANAGACAQRRIVPTPNAR